MHAAVLAYVRLTAGGTVSLLEGETVPAGVDADHVQELLEKGVLVDDGEPLTEQTVPSELEGQGAGADDQGDAGSGDPALGEEPTVDEPKDTVSEQPVTPAAKKAAPGKPGTRGGSPA